MPKNRKHLLLSFFVGVGGKSGDFKRKSPPPPPKKKGNHWAHVTEHKCIFVALPNESIVRFLPRFYQRLPWLPPE